MKKTALQVPFDKGIQELQGMCCSEAQWLLCFWMSTRSGCLIIWERVGQSRTIELYLDMIRYITDQDRTRTIRKPTKG